jgi:hypothetical protein
MNNAIWVKFPIFWTMLIQIQLKSKSTNITAMAEVGINSTGLLSIHHIMHCMHPTIRR